MNHGTSKIGNRFETFLLDEKSDKFDLTDSPEKSYPSTPFDFILDQMSLKKGHRDLLIDKGTCLKLNLYFLIPYLQ